MIFHEGSSFNEIQAAEVVNLFPIVASVLQQAHVFKSPAFPVQIKRMHL